MSSLRHMLCARDGASDAEAEPALLTARANKSCCRDVASSCRERGVCCARATGDAERVQRRSLRLMRSRICYIYSSVLYTSFTHASIQTHRHPGTRTGDFRLTAGLEPPTQTCMRTQATSLSTGPADSLDRDDVVERFSRLLLSAQIELMTRRRDII